MVNGGSERTRAPGEIYYLPGMGGRLDAGLGEELLRADLRLVVGRLSGPSRSYASANRSMRSNRTWSRGSGGQRRGS